MVAQIKMPRLSLTMTEGTVLKWFKEEGTPVTKGEPVLLVFGEKTEYEIESPEAGVLLKKLAMDNDEVPVSGLLGVVGEPGEEIPELVEEVKPESINERPISKPEISEPTIVTSSLSPSTSRVKASPAAKRLAKEHGINLSVIQPLGSRDLIQKRDIEQHITQIDTTKRLSQIKPMSPMRKIIANRMTMSSQSAPHIWIQMEADMSNVVNMRQILIQDSDPNVDVRISYTDILVKIVADAIKAHPIINSSLDGEEIQTFADINIGLAIQADYGLIVPVIRQADQKTVTNIAQTRVQLLTEIKKGTLPAEELSGGTFTITNLGPFGVETFLPIINPPESAILAVGQISEKPVVVKGKIEIRSMMSLTLAVDHRVIDGAPAAQFLATIKNLLENPYMLKL